MAHTTPVVRANVLRYQRHGQSHAIEVGTPAWYDWLRDEATFAVETEQGRFTARKERAGNRRGGSYWRAYRTSGNHLHRTYLGRSEDLTVERLGTAAQTLAGLASARPARPAASTTTAAPRAPGQRPRHDPLLTTKLYVPRPRTALVSRTRLVGHLQRGVEHALTVVVAPAGFGKTTLLSQWAGQASMPVTWLSLEPADDEPARFLAYLIAAVQCVRPHVGASALALLRTPQRAPLESVLAMLLNDLNDLNDLSARTPEAALARHTDAADGAAFALVLDDYHVIISEDIHRAVTFVADHMPPWMHVVLSTRTDPPLPLARLRAQGQLAEVRGEDLRFDGDDAATFLTEVMGLDLSAAEVGALAERTEGWIAGLQLAALSMRGHADPPGFIAALTGTSRYIMDYLSQEVLSRQPADVLRFLLRTALLERLCGPLCDAVTGQHDGQAMLERLEAANLFLVSLDQERRWYRYHHLFADVLRRWLRQTQPDEIGELHRLAGRWYEANGWHAEAIDHGLAGQDLAWVAQVLERHAATLFWKQGELQALQSWLGALPAALLREHPRLCVTDAWLRLWTGQLDAVEPLLAAATVVATSREGQPSSSANTAEVAAETETALLGEASTLRAEMARIRGDLPQAMASARKALTMLSAGNTDVNVDMRSISLGILAGVYRAGGAVRAAGQAYADASASMRAAGQIVPALIAYGYRVQVETEQGHLRAAADIYQQAARLASAYHVQTLAPFGVATAGMGDVLREWNDLDTAERQVREGIALCAQWEGLADDTLDGYLALARVHLSQHDYPAAQVAIGAADEIAAQARLPLLAMRVATARARLWLAQGTLAEARAWAAARLTDPPVEDTLSREQADEQLVLARVLVAERRWLEATQRLEHLLAGARDGGVNGRVLEIHVLQALACTAQAQTAQAMRALSQALAVAEPEGYVRLFVDEGAPMAALLRQAATRQLAPAYVGRLLAAFDGHGATSAHVSPALASPLSARELELLRLVAAGLATHEIAAELVIAPGTVRNHLKHLYGKLDAHSRVQAVERARALRLL